LDLTQDSGDGSGIGSGIGSGKYPLLFPVFENRQSRYVVSALVEDCVKNNCKCGALGGHKEKTYYRQG
jgi:Ni2+-binding GTPase involved in maturation of urease and hydrogenase